jgi:hypothetical protein
MAPGASIMIPISSGPLTAKAFTTLKEKTKYLHVLGAIEYESNGVPCYDVFCAVYDTDSGFFAACGGGSA